MIATAKLKHLNAVNKLPFEAVTKKSLVCFHQSLLP
jgi:hypothetical protein